MYRCRSDFPSNGGKRCRHHQASETGHALSSSGCDVFLSCICGDASNYRNQSLYSIARGCKDQVIMKRGKDEDTLGIWNRIYRSIYLGSRPPSRLVVHFQCCY